MTGSRMLLWLAAAAALGWSALAGAQQPAPRPKPAPAAAPKAPAGKQATLHYDIYLASHRQRLRRETCMKDEDMIAQYCVKRCQPGYLSITGNAVPRQCRSEKPLPAGQLPQAPRPQPAVQPVPPQPNAKRTPGA